VHLMDLGPQEVYHTMLYGKFHSNHCYVYYPRGTITEEVNWAGVHPQDPRLREIHSATMVIGYVESKREFNVTPA